jgi:putative inorganic carbon (hco3(-)) transporter
VTTLAREAEWWRPPSRPEEPAVQASAERGSRLPLRALLAFTFVLLLAPQAYVPALASLRLGLLAAGFAIVAHVYDRFTRGAALLSFTREIWLATALLGWAVVTLPFSWWPMGSVSFLLEIFAKAVIVFWLVGAVVTTPTRLARTAWTLSLLSVPLALTAVKNQIEGIFLQPGARGVRRIAGYDAPLTGNPNDLAAILNLILPLAIALYLHARRPAHRLLLGGVVLLDILGVISTFSRAGFLTLAIVVMVYAWKLHRRGRLPWALAALLLIALPMGPSGYLAHMSTITDIEADTTGSSQERWTLLVTALRFLATHPVVGTGIGLNVLAMNEGGAEVWREVHNAYLEYGVELGIPGMGLFLLLMWSCLRRTREARELARRTPGAERLFLLAEGVQVSLISYAVSALFHPLAYHFHFYYFAGLAVGLGAAAAALRPASPSAAEVTA